METAALLAENVELEIIASSGELMLGECVALRVRARNRGANLTRDPYVHVTASGFTLVSTSVWLRGEPAGSELAFMLPALLHEEICEIDIAAYAVREGGAHVGVHLECDRGARDARMDCSVRTAAAFAPAQNRLELPAGGEAGATVMGRVVLTNAGSARALVTAVTIAGDLAAEIDAAPFELAPGERKGIEFAAQIPAGAADEETLVLRAAAHVGGCIEPIALGTAQIAARSRPRMQGRLSCATSGVVDAGDSLVWELHLENAGGAPADSLSVALGVRGGTYAAGTTIIEDARVVDAGGTSVLWSRDGLRIEGLASGTGMTIGFRTVAEASDAGVAVWARVCCAGQELLLQPPPVEVRDWVSGASLPFIARGVVLRSLATAVAQPLLRRSPLAALEPATAAYIRGLGGLMRHLWALAVLCADRSEDAATAAHLPALRVALRSVFDRLAIKLRMPHYPVRVDDVLDPAAEDAMYAWTGARAASLGAGLAALARLIAPERDEYAELATYRDALRARLEAFADDTALIDALVATQPGLDAQLDAVIARELPSST